MKKHYNIFIALVAIFALSTSCSKWLDIKPEQITDEDELFSDYSGYYAALNGVYMEMADLELYGQNLSWGFASALGQYYNNNIEGMNFFHTEKYEFDTPEVRAVSEEIWTKGYNVIANCNNIINHINEVDASFFLSDQESYNAVKAEALAARAMMHFDLLRLYAPSPKADPEAKGIPYSTTYPDKVPVRLSVKEVIANIIKDLEQASELLAFERDEDYNYLNGTYSSKFAYENKFLSARYTHINGVATEALLARVHAYNNDMDNAFAYAKEIYDTYLRELEWWDYTKETVLNNASTERRASKLGRDIIFGLHYEPLVLAYSTLSTSNTNVAVNQNGYSIANALYMFTEKHNDVDDYRYTYLLENVGGSGNYNTLKYSNTSVDSEDPIIPIIRMSEMCSIIAEYYCVNEDFTSALDYLNELRKARSARERNLDPASITAAELMDEIDYDFWKENIAEGQYFFRAKRMNAPAIYRAATAVPMSEATYTLPIPDSETSLL